MNTTSQFEFLSYNKRPAKTTSKSRFTKVAIVAAVVLLVGGSYYLGASSVNPTTNHKGYLYQESSRRVEGLGLLRKVAGTMFHTPGRTAPRLSDAIRYEADEGPTFHLIPKQYNETVSGLKLLNT